MQWKHFLTEEKELYQWSVGLLVSGRGLVRPSVSATVVTGVKVGEVSVPGGEDLSGRPSFSAPAVRLRWREVVRMVGAQEVVWRGPVHHVGWRRGPRGQGPTPGRGHHVRVAVHLKVKHCSEGCSRQDYVWLSSLIFHYLLSLLSAWLSSLSSQQTRKTHRAEQGAESQSHSFIGFLSSFYPPQTHTRTGYLIWTF